jgi:DNA-binding beta-propeller fold protein YncE
VAVTGYVTTSAQTLSVFGPSLGLEQASILVGVGAGQILFSHDGSTIFVGDSTSQAILVIEAASGRTLRQYPVSIQVTSIALSPDEQTIYYGGVGATIVFGMNLASGQVVGTVPIPRTTEVTCLAISRDGATLFVGYGSGAFLPYPNCGSYEAEFAPPGGVLAARTKSFALEQVYNLGGAPPIAIAVTTDGSALITATRNNVTRYNVQTGAIEQTITTASPLTALALTPDDGGLLIAQSDAPLLLLNPVTLVQESEDGAVQATNFAFSSDGSTCFFANNLLLPSVLGSFSLSAFGTPHQRTLPLPTVSLAISPANNAVYVTSTDSASFSFDAATGAVGGFIETPGYVPLVAGRGGREAYGYGKPSGVQVYKPGNSLAVREIELSASNPFASSFVLSKNGRVGLAALEQSGSFSDQIAIAVVDMPSGSMTATVPIPLNLDLGILTAANTDATICYFESSDVDGFDVVVAALNLSSGQVVQTNIAGSTPVSLAPSPDGKYLYVGTAYGSQVTVLDASTLKILKVVSFPGTPTLTQIAVSPAGTKIYALLSDESAQNGELLELDAATLAVTRTLTALPQPYDFAVTPDGTRAYLTTFFAPGAPSLTVVDLTAFAQLAPVPLSAPGFFVTLPQTPN